MDLEPSFPARFSSRVGEVSQCPSDHISSRACPRLVHPHASTRAPQPHRWTPSPSRPLAFASDDAVARLRPIVVRRREHRRGRRRRSGLASTGGRSRGRGRGAGGDAPARAPTRARPRVLDEDEWTARLDAIITRDYFPDVPALRNKLEWLEAANSGDPARVLEAQRHIQRRLRDAARGAVLDTPSLANLTSAATGPTPTQSPSLRARSDHASPSPAAARDEWEDDEAPPSSTTRENRQSETELRVACPLTTRSSVSTDSSPSTTARITRTSAIFSSDKTRPNGGRWRRRSRARGPRRS